MNCPYCQSELFYQSVGKYYHVSCSDSKCRNPVIEEPNFLGFADFPPDRTITDYSLLLEVQGRYYTFTSTKLDNRPYSSLDVHRRQITEEPQLIFEWKEFIPFQNNLAFYKAKVERLLKLKAFW